MKAIAVVSDEGLGGVVPFGSGIRELGHRAVLLLGHRPDPVPEHWHTLYHEVLRVDNPYDPASLAEAACQAASGHELAGLFSCYDGLSLSAAIAARSLGCPHPAVGGLHAARNKFVTRELTRQAGLPTPRYARVYGAADLSVAASSVGFPAILKPLNGMASHLVRRVDNQRELATAYSYITTRLGISFGGNYSNWHWVAPDDDDPTCTLLLEQFVEGDEYSAEVLIRDGRVDRVALFHKFIVDPQGFLECGFAQLANGDRAREARLWEFIESVVATLHLDHAAAHIEVFDTGDGPRLVEVNAGRAGGQILVAAVKHATGVDLIAEILALALGTARPERAMPQSGERISTFTLFPGSSGRLQQIEGLDRLAALPRVAKVIPFCGPGDQVDATDKEFFAVNYLAQGGTDAELRALYDQARQHVRFHFARPSDGDGQRKFQPTSTLRALLSSHAPENGRVEVAGRARYGENGALLLADGGVELPLKWSHEVGHRLAPGSWLGVEATWCPATRELIAADLRFIRRPEPRAGDERARCNPEGACIDQPELLDPIRRRAQLMAWIRAYAERNGYLEVQTPLLRAQAESANVAQYELECVQGRKLYVRTDPEEYLKRYLTAGLDAVYEIALNVRGELPDRDRLHEFVTIEAYKRFGTLEDAIAFTHSLIGGALEAQRDQREACFRGRVIAWPETPLVRSFHDLVAEYAGLALNHYPTAQSLADECSRRGWAADDGLLVGSPRGRWIEWLFEERVAPCIDEATYVVDFPIELAMSACPSPADPRSSQRAELYMPGGWELAHLYENLTEPDALTDRLEQRLQRRLNAGYPRVSIDHALIRSARLGMPPMSGCAIGLDRLLMIALGTDRIGAGLMFAFEGFEELRP